MKKVPITLVLLFFLCSLFSQQTPQKYVKEIEYLTYYPDTYEADTSQSWPLVIFLHGSGERGDDIEKIKVHGPPMLIEQGKQFPFIIISPQANKYGWQPDFLMSMIRDFVEKNRVDETRIYLTGLSMGGYGTWATAMKYPNYFAAIAPICGGGNSTDAWKLRHLPIWCFHGKLDGIVPLKSSEVMVNAVKEHNPNVKFTIYPDTYHDSWIQAYNDPQLYEWMLSNKRFEFEQIEMDSTALIPYSGYYEVSLGSQKVDLLFEAKDGFLQADIQGRITKFFPAGNDHFFLDKRSPVEFKFIKDEQGVVKELTLFSDKIETFPKLKKDK